MTLAPGEEGHFETEWLASRTPRPVLNVTDAGAASEPFSAKVTGSTARLLGTFGVFYPGRAEISFKSRSGEELRVLTLGAVSPEEIFRVDRQVELPTGTWRISLNVRDVKGLDRGELGNVVLERGDL